MGGSVGLTLGKFAPFHKGHQLVVETALAEVDQLFVMIYDTDVCDIPLPVRAAWIKHLYPSVTIIEAWDGPSGYGDDERTKTEQEDYILQRLDGQPISHFYSSEFYGDHVSKALNAIDRRVNEARDVVPISGTAIRNNPFANRHYLEDVVYRDFITRACFLGAPSTGKSTISKALAKRYHSQYMPEYGAQYWLDNHIDRRLSLNQFEEIAPEHLRREEALVSECRDYLFCDTCALTTYHFAKDYHGQAGPILTACAQQAQQRYDLFFLCETDIPYDDSWDRSGDQKRQWFQRLIVADLNERKIPFIRLYGSLDQRMKTVDRILKSYRKFSNLLDILATRPDQQP